MKWVDEMNEMVVLEDLIKLSIFVVMVKVFICYLWIFVNELQVGLEYLEIIDDLEYKVDYFKMILSG